MSMHTFLGSMHLLLQPNNLSSQLLLNGSGKLQLCLYTLLFALASHQDLVEFIDATAYFLLLFIHGRLLCTTALLTSLRFTYAAIKLIYQCYMLIKLLRQFAQLALISQQPLLMSILPATTCQPASVVEHLTCQCNHLLKRQTGRRRAF